MADTPSDDPFFSTWRYNKPRRRARREERAAWEAQLVGSQGAASECRALRLRTACRWSKCPKEQMQKTTERCRFISL
jgi:transposase